jgi:hypothetical protein
MSLEQISHEYDELPPNEQSQFANAVRRLLSDGLIWREEPTDRASFDFLRRRASFVSRYLAMAGWELRHVDHLGIFHVVHREGAHRRRLNRDTSIWLLLLRLLYAEQRERLEVQLTKYPTIDVGDVFLRYAAFFPGQQTRKRTSLNEALRMFQNLKLIRAAHGSKIRNTNESQLIELLPTLEVIIPASAVDELIQRIEEYQQSGDNDAQEEED